MAKVTVVKCNLTVEERRKNLKHLYETIRKIARNLEERGVDISDLFYTKEEIEKLKKEKPECFI